MNEAWRWIVRIGTVLKGCAAKHFFQIDEVMFFLQTYFKPLPRTCIGQSLGSSVESNETGFQNLRKCISFLGQSETLPFCLKDRITQKWKRKKRAWRRQNKKEKMALCRSSISLHFFLSKSEMLIPKGDYLLMIAVVPPCEKVVFHRKDEQGIATFWT